MQRNRSIALGGLVGVAMWCVAGLACAQQAPDADLSSIASQPVVVTPAFVEPVPVDATAAPDAAFGTAVDPGALSDLRGGDAQVVDNDILVNGRVEDAIADDVLTGSNAVTSGSFANASGISTVIQNTGANVLIQNAMIVNVKFADAGP
ncbi:hypothetical protein [Lysobacter auxotrophicus]|uniref:Uncharacterized protein n=1 Tax=Lysobacter auxotrophicus TaxID=2992573 RepID=A0ABN6UKG4_9GAMM|nr:hypothetical protein [Lysobacter auxotrophicus]BDU16818.1 hypothetical protein LA521A_20190 [Lysobacter auxotrophicus]